MKSLKNTLRKRFIFIVLLHTMVTLVSVYVIILFNMHRSAKWELTKFEGRLFERLQQDLDKGLENTIFTLGVGEESRYSFMAKYNDGAIMQSGPYAEELSDRAVGFELISYKSFSECRKLVGQDFTLLTAVHVELDLIDDTWWIFLLSLPFLLCPALYFSFKTFEQVTLPLKTISQTLCEIEQGDLKARAKETGSHDESDLLIQRLNGTLAKLENLFSQAQRFNAHAAHELKTPLTVIKGEIDLCLSGKLDLVKGEECLLKVQEEVHYLTGVIDNLLMISTPGDEHKKASKKLDVTEAYSEIEDLLAILAAERNISLLVSAVPGEIFGSVKLISRAFFNLVENAIKYSPAESEIIIKMSSSAFSVEDCAPVLSDEDRRNILLPFYRKNPEVKGVGLGLSIVQWICQIHGFKLEISLSTNGNRFEIYF